MSRVNRRLAAFFAAFLLAMPLSAQARIPIGHAEATGKAEPWRVECADEKTVMACQLIRRQIKPGIGDAAEEEAVEFVYNLFGHGNADGKPPFIQHEPALIRLTRLEIANQFEGITLLFRDRKEAVAGDPPEGARQGRLFRERVVDLTYFPLTDPGKREATVRFRRKPDNRVLQVYLSLEGFEKALAEATAKITAFRPK
ncbi:MAG: hypothetical protein KIT81_11485 [Alphaproteobacteria bacterium]|nr:hypothetical protein [Alphaproteobacteria bacterium]